MVGIVSLQALVSQTSFRMQDLQIRAKALQQHYGEQTLIVARLSAPERIAAAAHRAGLQLPDPSQVHTLRCPRLERRAGSRPASGERVGVPRWRPGRLLPEGGPRSATVSRGEPQAPASRLVAIFVVSALGLAAIMARLVVLQVRDAGARQLRRSTSGCGT